jgi:hypothetical protein
LVATVAASPGFASLDRRFRPASMFVSARCRRLSIILCANCYLLSCTRRQRLYGKAAYEWECVLTIVTLLGVLTRRRRRGSDAGRASRAEVLICSRADGRQKQHTPTQNELHT